jgi:hypothetical protein
MEHRGAMAVEPQMDSADEPAEVARPALLRELDLGLDDLAEVTLEAIQLALCRVAHLLPETVGTVVQDDLHNPNISPVFLVV